MVNGLAVLFCELVIGVFLAVLIGAFILKASCALFDLLAGALEKPTNRQGTGRPAIDSLIKANSDTEPGEDWEAYERIVTSPGVPIPRFEWAMRIIFFATIVNTSGSFIILRVVRLAGQTLVRGTFGSLPIFLISSPLGMLVLGGICAAMLPTSFGKGLLVSLLFHFLITLIAAVVVTLAVAFGIGVTWFG